MKQLSPLAQLVSETASNMNNTIFRTPILSRDNFMAPKRERHMVTMTECTQQSKQNNEAIKGLKKNVAVQNNFTSYDLKIRLYRPIKHNIMFIVLESNNMIETQF